jgi:hypothetical protein
MTNKRLIQILLGILYLVLTYGIVGPWLLSQASNIAFALGILVVVIVPAFIVINIKKILK